MIIKKLLNIFVILYECLNKNETCYNIIFIKYYFKLHDLTFLIIHNIICNYNMFEFEFRKLFVDANPLYSADSRGYTVLNFYSLSYNN